MSSTIGFIGIGMMGGHMIKRLLDAEHRVVAYDVSVENLKAATENGAVPASSSRTVAEAADIVITMLPSSVEVEDAVLGESGFVQGAREGSILIDMSTSRPQSTKYIAGELSSRGIHMLDAPVSGGVAGAKEGNLCILVGGEEEIFRKCFPIFEILGKHIFHLGKSGSGHIMKAANNFLAALLVVASGEAFTLAVKAGLESTKIAEVLKVTTGRNYATEIKFPKYILPRTFDDGFRLDLYLKDLNILHELAEEYQVPTPIAENVLKIYTRAHDLGYGSESHTSIIRMLEKDAGVIIKG
jgi:2-hydroxy-3-oxopropionate reductase